MTSFCRIIYDVCLEWFCCISMTMNNYTDTYACRIITMTQQRRATQFFRKIYLSLYWKGCVWEGVGDRTELQHIDPHSYGHNSVSFLFSWAAQPGGWGPSLSGTRSPFQNFLSNSSCSIGGPEGPFCWVLVLSAASCLQLSDFLSSPGLYNCSTSTFFLWASQIALNSTHPR